MPQFTVNAQRFDPYKNFKFRVKWDGRYVAGVSKISALKRSTEVVEAMSARSAVTFRSLTDIVSIPLLFRLRNIGAVLLFRRPL